MAATSQSPPAIPPGVKLDIKLELADGSFLPLTENQILKSLTIKDVTVDTNLYSAVIPIKKYLADEVRRFFRLFDQIEQKANLAQHKVTLSQLFDLLPLADFFAAETLVGNLLDYILATIAANLTMSEKVKKEVQSKYGQLSVILQEAVYDRLANLMSIKHVRTLLVSEPIGKSYSELDDVIITDYNQIVASYMKPSTEYKQLYDETDGRRAKKLNLLRESIEEFKLGGISGGKTSVLFSTSVYDSHTEMNVIKSEYYGPGLLIGLDLPSFPSHLLRYGQRSHLLLYGQRAVIISPYHSKILDKALSIYKAARISGQQFDELDRRIFTRQFSQIFSQLTYQIIELPSKKVLFFNFIPDVIQQDDGGEYVAALTQYGSAGLIIELFEVDSKKRLFRIILNRTVLWFHEEIIPVTIDPIRRLLYVRLENRVKVHYPTTDVSNWLVVILVVNFEGKVIHRYLSPHYINFNPAGSRLVTVEEYISKQPLVEKFTVLEEHIAEGIDPSSSTSIPDKDLSKYQEMAQLPYYELMPNLPLNPKEYKYDPEFEAFRYSGVWLRDPDNGFQPIARITDLTTHFIEHADMGLNVDNVEINSSPAGHYIALNVNITEKAEVYKLTLYNKAEAEAIIDILTPPAKLEAEPSTLNTAPLSPVPYVPIPPAEILPVIAQCIAPYDYTIEELISKTGAGGLVYSLCKDCKANYILKFSDYVPPPDYDELTLEEECQFTRRAAELGVAPKVYLCDKCIVKGKEVWYIIMERLRGPTYAEIYKDNLTHIPKILDRYVFLLNQGIDQYDLNAGNIMYGVTYTDGSDVGFYDQNKIYIIDYGLARPSTDYSQEKREKSIRLMVDILVDISSDDANLSIEELAQATILANDWLKKHVTYPSGNKPLFIPSRYNERQWNPEGSKYNAVEIAKFEAILKAGGYVIGKEET